MTDRAISIGSGVLETLIPMHVVVDGEGTILSIGRALAKIGDGMCEIGGGFFQTFSVRRQRPIDSMAGLREAAGKRLHLRLRSQSGRSIKAVALPLSDGESMIIALSFGIHVAEMISQHRLTASDFAPTDLVFEMLFLIEANSAATAEWRQLNQRLEDARILAEEQAATDVLTGAKNRRAFEIALERLIEARKPFAFLMIDLDRFKSINDTYGHAAGDELLRRIAAILADATRSCDTVGRIGGDEFAVILDGLTDEDLLKVISTRIVDSLKEPIAVNGQKFVATASIGAVLAPVSRRFTLEELVHSADTALFASKRDGRARVTLGGDAGQPEPRVGT